MALFGNDDPNKQLEKEQRKQQKEMDKSEKAAERATQMAERTRHIDVFTIPHLPDRDCTALGMVSAETHKHIRILSHGINIGLPELIDELKKQTRELGGDAILGFQMNCLINEDKDHWATSYAYGTAISYGKREDKE